VARNQMQIMLMFTGQAEEAIGFYVDLFDDSGIESVENYGDDNPGMAGQIVHARVRIAGQLVLVMDSPPVHDFTFTPSTSFFVSCDSDSEVDRLFSALSEGGSVLMALDVYPFAKRYAWVNDRFGVSWQLVYR
jgi:predicted 3-demethylubiquinone-9 3-methyltransferase (glyoxalase superfamily)